MINRAVKQKDKNGNLIAIFHKMEDAAKDTHTNYASISRCCRGHQHSANGFIWEFDNSNLKVKTDPLDKFLDFLNT